LSVTQGRNHASGGEQVNHPGICIIKISRGRNEHRDNAVLAGNLAHYTAIAINDHDKTIEPTTDIAVQRAIAEAVTWRL
jgi:hypothetical protein